MNKIPETIAIKENNLILKTILEKIGFSYKIIKSNEWLESNDFLYIDCLKNSKYEFDVIDSNTISYIDINGKKRDLCYKQKVYKTKVKGKTDIFLETKVTDENYNVNDINVIFEDNILYLPFDLENVDHIKDKGYRPYYSESADKTFIERGPYVDYGALRRYIYQNIGKLFIKYNGSFVKRESTLNNLFSFRIDVDSYELTNENMNRTMDLEDLFGYRFTYYFDVEGYKKLNKDTLSRFKGRDIQLHCNKHYVYTNYLFNNIDHKKAIRWIKKNLDTSINAEASPFGIYDQTHQRANKSIGLIYGSEFEYNIDDYPEATKYNIQIPIHCASLGVLEESNFTKEEMLNEYISSAINSIKNNGVAIMYEHPFAIGPNYEMFVKIFNELKKNGYKYINMLDYAKNYFGKDNYVNKKLDEKSFLLEVSLLGNDMFVPTKKDWLNAKEKFDIQNTGFVGDIKFVVGKIIGM